MPVHLAVGPLLSLIAYLLFQMMTPFLFNDPPTTQIYTLSLHDALPISAVSMQEHRQERQTSKPATNPTDVPLHGMLASLHRRTRQESNLSAQTNSRRNLHVQSRLRSEEHTSELQSLRHLVCRLLLEKKK